MNTFNNNYSTNNVPFYYDVLNIMNQLHRNTMSGSVTWYEINELAAEEDDDLSKLYHRQQGVMRGEMNSAYYCEMDGLIITIANAKRFGCGFDDMIVTIADSESMDQMVVVSTVSTQFEIARCMRMLWNQLHHFSSIVNGRVDIKVKKHIA